MTDAPQPRPAAPMIARAVALGRMPGEPATVLMPGSRPPLLAQLFGKRQRRPLADPRLEVLRAISAALAGGMLRKHGDLIAAAHQVGWTAQDLHDVFGSRLGEHST